MRASEVFETSLLEAGDADRYHFANHYALKDFLADRLGIRKNGIWKVPSLSVYHMTWDDFNIQEIL